MEERNDVVSEMASPSPNVESESMTMSWSNSEASAIAGPDTYQSSAGEQRQSQDSNGESCGDAFYARSSSAAAARRGFHAAIVICRLASVQQDVESRRSFSSEYSRPLIDDSCRRRRSIRTFRWKSPVLSSTRAELIYHAGRAYELRRCATYMRSP